VFSGAQLESSANGAGIPETEGVARALPSSTMVQPVGLQCGLCVAKQ